jgi:hypothetical protein
MVEATTEKGGRSHLAENLADLANDERPIANDRF